MRISVAAVVFLSVASFVEKNEATLKKKTFYVDFERPLVLYRNPVFYWFLNVTSLRFGRSDPIHYVQAHFGSLVPIGNNVTMHMYIYEFLSNEYRRSFVEMHFKLCDLLWKDKIFGPFFNKSFPRTCPLPKGSYFMSNVSIPDLPQLDTFPFRKGRLFINETIQSQDGKLHRLAEIQIDVVIRQRWSQS